MPVYRVRKINSITIDKVNRSFRLKVNRPLRLSHGPTGPPGNDGKSGASDHGELTGVLGFGQYHVTEETSSELEAPESQLDELKTTGSPGFYAIHVGCPFLPQASFFATGGETVEDGKADLYLKAQNTSTGIGGNIIIGAGSGPLGPGIISLEGEVYSGVLNIGAPTISGVNLSGGVDTSTVSGAPDRLCSSAAVQASLNDLANNISALNNVVSDTDLPPSEAIKGMMRYRELTDGGSVFSICMKKKDDTYAWVDIVENI